MLKLCKSMRLQPYTKINRQISNVESSEIYSLSWERKAVAYTILNEQSWKYTCEQHYTSCVV